MREGSYHWSRKSNFTNKQWANNWLTMIQELSEVVYELKPEREQYFLSSSPNLKAIRGYKMRTDQKERSHLAK